MDNQQKTPSTKENKLIRNIISQFLDIQEGENWIDESFKKKIDNVTADKVFVRPHPQLHSVGELVSHILEWRRASMDRLRGRQPSLTVNSPENWRTNDELISIGWAKLKSDFYLSTHQLIEILEDKDDSFLENTYKDVYSFHYLIEGLVHHDLYHLGQIGLTIKFLNSEG